MHPSEKIQRILNQSLKCSYAQTEVICSLYVHYVTETTHIGGQVAAHRPFILYRMPVEIMG